MEEKIAIEILKNKGFTESDFDQIKGHGISMSKIAKELSIFEAGISKVTLDKPATINDGIVKLSKLEFQNLAATFDSKRDSLKLKKFVPASGAASRMFKFLNEFLNDYQPENETINAYINRKKDKNLPIFLAGIEKFPFYETIKDKLKLTHKNYYSMDSHQKSYHFIKTMLSSEYFDFANKPKGVLDFHKYATHTATPVEEHLNECAFYASANAVSHLHFTISESHEDLFKKTIENIKTKVENKSGTSIKVRFSYQDKATDTIAVDMQNKPLRYEDGKLVFRPAGHGALITNLKNLDADIIFIKNIDNVIQNHIEETTLYKKALGGILIDLQSQVFSIVKAIDNEELNEDYLPEIVDFMSNKLNIKFYDGFDKYTFKNKIESIKNKLNRPIRICGMVKNEGEPGGGPFWVRDEKGHLTLQIVESSQIDVHNSKQAEILAMSTHFNPVDLVCSTKNHKGEKFDLNKFVNHNTGFIVQKNNKGKVLKSYELPGLWNGAMAKWITVFVEVPLVTFNPVKTVNDLLKPAHQPQHEN
jgi:Domain of unknown function (DUF4301)